MERAVRAEAEEPAFAARAVLRVRMRVRSLGRPSPDAPPQASLTPVTSAIPRWARRAARA